MTRLLAALKRFWYVPDAAAMQAETVAYTKDYAAFRRTVWWRLCKAADIDRLAMNGLISHEERTRILGDLK